MALLYRCLFSSGSAVIAFTVVATAFATESRRRDREPSRDLRALIKAHRAAYAAFGKTIHEMDGSNRDRDRAGRAKERALLGVWQESLVVRRLRSRR